ncbi:Pentatricopeptide repeat-containing protein [Abeliophyllum distichum]|uniref:Pentatricopeptide repeat-containing protein n=1 Tax=Abeliophyllum distichum TaxID=126358 RepID=A0ABD1P7S9_9LAMI
MSSWLDIFKCRASSTFENVESRIWSVKRSYSARQAVTTAYGALCSVLCSVPVASNGRQNHVILSSFIDRFIGWALPSLSNIGDGTAELALDGLHNDPIFSEFGVVYISDVFALLRYCNSSFGVNMVVIEVFRSPFASTISLDGYNHQYQSYCGSKRNDFRTHFKFMKCMRCLNGEPKANKSSTRIHGRIVVAIAEECEILSRTANRRMPRMGLLYKPMEIHNSFTLPIKVASVEFESVCEEKRMQVLKENEDISENCTQPKLPPWGNVIDQNLEVQNNGGSTSRVSKGAVDLIEDGLCYLEERDEEILSKRILNLSRLNKVRSVLELYRSMVFSGLRPDLHACNSLLSCLLRNGRLDDALKIFEFMKASEMMTGHTYSLVLKAVANSWGCDAALNMFEEAERDSSSKKYFDVVVYNTMISMFGKVKNWAKVKRMWRSLLDNGHVGTLVTYRLLVCIFVRCSQHELALDAYQEMVRNQLSPTGKVELAFKVFAVLKSLGHAPHAYTWNALLCALYRANRHADVLRLFDSIRRDHDSVLNLHIYNTALMSCQRLALWDRALQLLWQMEAVGFSISTASYNLAIGACETARKPKVALQVFEHMVHQKQSPDTFTLLSLIRGCIWGSLWNKVEEILNSCGEQGEERGVGE